MFHHIFDSVMACFGPIFRSKGLQVPRPGAWDAVSDRHLEVMHSVMANLHTQLVERYLDASKLPIRESSWEKLLKSEMLNDDIVDWMALKLCQAVGSTMAGDRSRGGAVPVSPLLQISPEHAERFFVIGVMIAEQLRMSGLKNDKTPILRMLVGKTNVQAVQEGRLDPFHHKSLLVLQTNDKKVHTSLQELVLPCDSAAKSTWTHCIYDSADANPNVDTALHKGIRSIMVKTGLIRRTDRFKRTHPIRFIKQKDSTVCGLTTFINLVQKLTGEVLDRIHWDLFVDLVRLFFDLWIFYLAESNGAIRPGCLAWESCSPAGPGGNACCAQKGVAGLSLEIKVTPPCARPPQAPWMRQAAARATAGRRLAPAGARGRRTPALAALARQVAACPVPPPACPSLGS